MDAEPGPVAFRGQPGRAMAGAAGAHGGQQQVLEEIGEPVGASMHLVAFDPAFDARQGRVAGGEPGQKPAQRQGLHLGKAGIRHGRMAMIGKGAGGDGAALGPHARGEGGQGAAGAPRPCESRRRALNILRNQVGTRHVAFLSGLAAGRSSSAFVQGSKGKGLRNPQPAPSMDASRASASIPAQSPEASLSAGATQDPPTQAILASDR